MERGTLAKVVREFFTTTEGELSLNKGDFLLVYNVIDKHWCYGEFKKQRGKFPLDHLIKVDVPIVDESSSLFLSISPFCSEQAGDLSFEKGQIIVGRSEVQPGWYSGYCDSKKGIFPTSHVWQLDRSILKDPRKKKTIHKRARVKTSLKAQLDEELDLREGEVVTILEINEDGWCLGITADNRKGTFPEAFVTYIEEDGADETDLSPETIRDPFPQSAQNNGRIFKDFEKATTHLFTCPEDPAPNYYDLYPEYSRQSSSRIGSIDPKFEPQTSLQRFTDVVQYEEEDDDNVHPLGVTPYAITLYPFNAQFVNELSFQAGEIVHLLRYIDSEWAEGTINLVKGIFPVSYVNVIVDCKEASQKEEKSNNFVKQDNVFKLDSRARVAYTFNAQMDGDLSVEEGDIVTVSDVVNNDWIIVRDQEGNYGSCPSSYLVPIETPEAEISNLDDFVLLRNHEDVIVESEKFKRLSQPHRPAPPAPVPGSVPLSKQSNNLLNDVDAEMKKKKFEKRQNVISEIVLTEKEYIKDLRVTYETFNLSDPSFLEIKGIDVFTLFGNIWEIAQVAEKLLDSILRSMKDHKEEAQLIGPCFVKMAVEMQSAYAKYCTNYKAASVLLQKYRENKEIMAIFDKGVETLRRQVICFDMDSILIKPVQRILKYPLFLHELFENTEDDHPDKLNLKEACNVMSDVAKHINEVKRRKDIISKYWEGDNTFMHKLTKFNMHSVSKKSARSIAMITASLGATHLARDLEYDELAKQFRALEICTKQLREDIQQCVRYLKEGTLCGEVLSGLLFQYNEGTPDNEINQLYNTQTLIKARFLQNLEDCVEKRVNKPLRDLEKLLEGPDILMRKRYDKRLDYDTAISKSERDKDNRNVQEELNIVKSNFQALDQQLKEELPIFIQAGIKILSLCIKAFADSRKLFSGRVLNEFMNLSESANKFDLDNILDSFLEHHYRVYNQISRLKSLSGSNASVEEIRGMPIKSSSSIQDERQRYLLKNSYPIDKLYIVSENVIGKTVYDLSVINGTLVAVIKEKDPTGNTAKWFVNDGNSKGFVPSSCLRPLRHTQENNHNESAGFVDEAILAGDLISLNSNAKESSKQNMELRSLSSQQLYMNSSVPFENFNIYQNLNEATSPDLYYALYDFTGTLEGTMSVVSDQALKLIQPHDEKGNKDWWLMENWNGDRGYVPNNHLGTLRGSLSDSSAHLKHPS